MPRSAAAVTASLSRVPPFPPIAAKLLGLLARDSVDLAEVAELISSDATFTARLLQRVNSAEFGLVSNIGSVKQAVALLGIDLTRKIIVSHATAVYARKALGTEELRRCWQHTMATAVLADEIAQACNEFTQGAFTAGIVHDIGRLGLLVAYPEDYERLIRDAADRCLDLLDYEHEEFGLDHAAAGRMLAERWDLPSEMASIAGRHHDPTEGTELSLLRIVHVACRLADALGFYVVKPLTELALDDVLAELPARARKGLNSDPDQFRLRVERAISDYESQPSGRAPEETLALLSPAPSGEETVPAPTEEETALTDSQMSEKSKPLPLAWAVIAGFVLVGLVIAFYMWTR
jgi:HD-like signal output (HDOD) protein